LDGDKEQLGMVVIRGNSVVMLEVSAFLTWKRWRQRKVVVSTGDTRLLLMVPSTRLSRELEMEGTGSEYAAENAESDGALWRSWRTKTYNHEDRTMCSGLEMPRPATTVTNSF
jgi:hypothetical protein